MSCAHCHAPTADGMTLCPRHLDDLSRLLNGLEATLEDADITIAKLDQLGGGAGTNDPAAGSAAPLNLEASERKRTLVEAIHQWARVILEDDTDPHVHGLAPLTYLRLSVDLIKKRDDAGELLRELSEANRYLLVAIDRPPSIILLGRCATTIEGQQCPEMIRARHGEHEARCRTCGATYIVEDVQAQALADAWHEYGTLPTVVKAMRHMVKKVTLRSAQRWAKDGDLVPHRHDHDGTPMYTAAQVLQVSTQMRARHGGKRVDKTHQVA